MVLDKPIAAVDINFLEILIIHQTIKDSDEKLKVCVVGSGATGLCAMRHFLSRPDRFELVVGYEQCDQIGGTWNYSDMVGINQQNGLPVHSSMYKNLYTNLPMEIMAFPDFPSKCSRSFVHHTEVLNYLKNYADHFQLLSKIKFNHQIVNITRKNDQWSVTIKDVKLGHEFTKFFDVILICVGRYSKPYWPPYNTMERFQGSIIHSHDYREPEAYKNQRVAVIGGGLSGVDISIELAKKSKEIVFFNRGDQYKNLPNNIKQINGEIREFGLDFISVGNEKNQQMMIHKIDSIILTTGYLYDLKFLDPECGVQANPDGTIDGLYRHLINIKHTSMALLGVLMKVLPFAVCHQQILYFMKSILGEFELPNKISMIEETKIDYQKALTFNLKTKNRHVMKNRMIEYLDKLVIDAQIPAIPKVILQIYEDLFAVRENNITGYKEINLKILSDDEYTRC